MNKASAIPPPVTAETPDPPRPVDLLESVRAIAPTIREHAPEGERNRRLARPVLDALSAAGLFRLLVPRSLGGEEIDPVTFARAVEEVSLHDSSAGWAVMIGNAADWWCCRLPDEGAEEIYAQGPDTIIASVIHPPMLAFPADAGYRLTGRRALASSIHDAGWLMVTAIAEQRFIAAIVPAADAEILDTWHSLGMRATDSNDVALHDVVVPVSRTFPWTPAFQPGSHYRGPLYRISAMAALGSSLAPVPLAVARAALDEFRALASAKTPYGSTRTLAQRPVVQAALARTEASLRAARSLFYATLEAAWGRALAGDAPTVEQRAEDLMAAVHAVSSAVAVVDVLHGLAGTSGIYEGTPLERHFRDIHTIRQHGFAAESRFETVGQVLLGLPPEFALVSF